MCRERPAIDFARGCWYNHSAMDKEKTLALTILSDPRRRRPPPACGERVGFCACLGPLGRAPRPSGGGAALEIQKARGDTLPRRRGGLRPRWGLHRADGRGLRDTPGPRLRIIQRRRREPLRGAAEAHRARRALRARPGRHHNGRGALSARHAAGGVPAGRYSPWT